MNKFLSTCFSALAASSSVLAEPETYFTAPQTPVANSPWSIVLPVQTLGGRDMNPLTSPSAEVFGDTIRIHVNAECDIPVCDVIVRSIVRVDVPPVPAGRYRIEVLPDGQGLGVTPTMIDVIEKAKEPDVRPVDGFWYDVSRPGSGLFLRTEGDLTAIGIFTYTEGEGAQPIWMIDTAPIYGADLVSAPRVAPRWVTSPACLACAMGSPPELRLALSAMYVRFTSERQAMVTIDDFSFVIDALPLSGYLETALTIASHLPPLPAISGRWVVDVPPAPAVLTYGTPSVEADRVSFPSDRGELVCLSHVSDGVRCTFVSTDPALDGLYAAGGDMSSDRVTFRSSIIDVTISSIKLQY